MSLIPNLPRHLCQRICRFCEEMGLSFEIGHDLIAFVNLGGRGGPLHQGQEADEQQPVGKR